MPSAIQAKSFFIPNLFAQVPQFKKMDAGNSRYAVFENAIDEI
jgi:hypothetical protein